MSGPKHSAYDVRENALRRAREAEAARLRELARAKERQSALDRAARLRPELLAMIAQIDEFDPGHAAKLRRELEALPVVDDASEQGHQRILASPDVIEAMTAAAGHLVAARRRLERQAERSSGLADMVARQRATARAAQDARIEAWRADTLARVAELQGRAKGSLARSEERR